jgi:predicted nucleotidyltransferase
MTDISNTLIIDPSRPVSREVKEALRGIDGAAKRQGVRFLVVGAQARELVLYNVFGISTNRFTNDVDFGICVENWTEFERMKDSLIATGLYRSLPYKKQRLEHTSGGAPIDLLPFGGIERDGTIVWPPDLRTVMNVAGYEEALRSSISVKIEDDFLVPVVSLPALVILKLFAWIDRRLDNLKDAQDLWLIFDTYHEVSRDDLFGQNVNLLEGAGWVEEVAGIRLLAAEIVKLCKTETLGKLKEAITKKNLSRLLIEDIISQNPRFDNSAFSERVEKNVKVFFDALRAI